MNRSERRKLEKQKNKAAKNRGGGVFVLPEARAPLQNAIELFTRGQLGPAETACRNVLEIDPDQPVALNLLGLIAQRAGNADAAIRFFSLTIEKAPGFPDAQNNLGNLLLERGELNQASACFDKAVKLNPKFAEAFYNRSRVGAKLGEVDKALHDCDMAIKLRPKYPEAHNGKGIILSLQDRFDEAIESYRAALAINPDFPDALTNLSLLLSSEEQFEEAESLARRAVELFPRSPKAHNNLGIVLRNKGNFSEAVESFRAAIERNPDNAESYDNLGNAFYNLGDLEEAMACYQESLSLLPENPTARNNMSLIQLLDGDFAQGWRNYECRLQVVGYNATEHPAMSLGREWQGEDVSGKNILLWSEQGVGEQVLFAGLIAELSERGASVSVQCDSRLVPLLSRSFPDASFMDEKGLKSVVKEDFDFNAAVGNIGKWLRPDLSAFTEPMAYLQADVTKSKELREKYLSHGYNKLIGLAWKSSGPSYGERKSISPEDLAPILKIPDTTFVDLQYGDVESDREVLRTLADGRFIVDEDIDQMASLDDFAAQISALDGVVTISNTTAHFAGALGLPTALMLGKVPLWYWQLGRTDSLWYPHVHLFRQSELDDWSGVARDVASFLPTLTSGQ